MTSPAGPRAAACFPLPYLQAPRGLAAAQGPEVTVLSAPGETGIIKPRPERETPASPGLDCLPS